MNTTRELLKEAVQKLEHYANRQGKHRAGHGRAINPHEGEHYPAVQSFLDRARNEIQGKRDETKILVATPKPAA